MCSLDHPEMPELVSIIPGSPSFAHTVPSTWSSISNLPSLRLSVKQPSLIPSYLLAKCSQPQPLVDASYRAHHPCQALGDLEAELLFSGLLVHHGQGPHPVPLYFSWCPHGPDPGLAQS